MKLLSEDIYIYPGLMPCGVFQPKCVLDAHSLTHADRIWKLKHSFESIACVIQMTYELIHFSESETYIMTSEVQFLN